jgi:poly-beta-1,6-N-acetyl-D-glucosamine N-deacetylase
MRWLTLIVLVLASCMTTAVAAAGARDPVAAGPSIAVVGTFTGLCYHEARDEVRDYPDPYAVDTAALVRQFAWLRGSGYTPVSLDEIVAARQGGKPLPAKAVLLSFDDAYLSFYTRVYPLLREFRFPALLGVVGKWIDNPSGGPVLYGEKGTVPDASFPTWSQLREMADSGLVEMASHTYDLHHGVPANPQGNLQFAATARTYDATTGSYEGDASWRARVRADLANSASVIKREIGRSPRAIVWPYGSYNDELVRMAGELGMSIAFTLDDGANTPDVPLTALRRTLVEHNPTLAAFTIEVRGPLYPEAIRVVQVNLDDVYSANPAQQERNLSALLDRIEVLKPTHVYLQATADTDGDGIAVAAYFPNRHLPLRGDLFNRAAWQLTTRNDVKVFAMLPVTGFRLPPIHIAEVYEDLARHANFDGLVFNDRSQPGGVEDADTLEFTRQLAMRARAFRAPLKTVRTMNIEPSPSTAPGTAATLQNAQRFAAFAVAYDYVALVATPTRENAASFDAWLTSLVARVGRAPGDPDILRKVVFMLQNGPLPSDRLARNLIARQMRALQLGGALNFGYGPDDFPHNDPPLAQIAPAMSLRIYPLAPGNKER